MIAFYLSLSGLVLAIGWVINMAYVMPHTTKLGASVRRDTVKIDEYYVAGGGFRQTVYYYNTPLGLHFKSGTQRSDGRKPTNYSRCIISAIGNSIDFHDGLLRKKGSNSFYSNGLYMNTQPWSQLGLLSGSVSPSAYLRAAAINNAIVKLHGNQANILEDLAQATQTARMFHDIVKDIIQRTGRFLSAYGAILTAAGITSNGPSKPGKRPPRQGNYVKRLAKAWLVWYYGVKPLISTINQVAKAWEPKYKTIKSVSKQRAQLDPSSLFTNSAYGRNKITVTGSTHEEVTCKLICDVKLSSNINSLANLGYHGGDPYADSVRGAMQEGGSANDLLTTGWALIPYSFVFDWIIPVEKFLRTLYWSPLIQYKGGYVTSYMGGTAYGRIENPTSGSVYGGKTPSGRVECLLFQRQAYSNYPPPSILAVNRSISPPTLASAIALILSR